MSPHIPDWSLQGLPTLSDGDDGEAILFLPKLL